MVFWSIICRLVITTNEALLSYETEAILVFFYSFKLISVFTSCHPFTAHVFGNVILNITE